MPVSEGQILNLTVPPLDLNLLGLVAGDLADHGQRQRRSGRRLLLGNVLTTALKTLDATPENLAELNTNINGILAKVVGVLNAADLSLACRRGGCAAAAVQTLVSPTLTAPRPAPLRRFST